MISLGRVLEQLEESMLAEENNMPSSGLTAAVRAGLNLRPDFWDDFMKVCNQSTALAELLGVRKEIISRWPMVIRSTVEKVRQMDNHESSQGTARLIRTGMGDESIE